MSKQLLCFECWEGIQAFVREHPMKPLPEALQAHSVGCNNCKTKLLAFYALLLPEHVSIQLISCDMIFEQIDQYVEQEQQDCAAALRTYPQIWNHIATCERCSELYTMLSEAVQQSQTEQCSHTADTPQTFDHMFSYSSDMFSNVLKSPQKAYKGYKNLGNNQKPVVILDHFPALLDDYTLSVSVSPHEEQPWRLHISLSPPAEGEVLVRLNRIATKARLVNGYASLLVTEEDVFERSGEFEVYFVPHS